MSRKTDFLLVLENTPTILSCDGVLSLFQRKDKKRNFDGTERSVQNSVYTTTNFSLSPQNCEFSNSLKTGLSIISKNSLRDSQKFAQPQNRVCISQKRSQKDSNLRPLLRREMNHTGWTKAHLHYSSTLPR